MYAYLAGDTTSGTKSICGPNLGSTFTAYCSGDEGGGWMLMFAYYHIGGQSNALNPNTLPTSLNGYSHRHITYLSGYGFTESHISEVRFYCDTSNTGGNTIHFKTSTAGVRGIAWDGNQAGNTISWWTSYTILTGGSSARLPSQTANVQTGQGSFYFEPFYKGSTYHWNVNYIGRFECGMYFLSFFFSLRSKFQHYFFTNLVLYFSFFFPDDYPNNNAHTTHHRVWVRTL